MIFLRHSSAFNFTMSQIMGVIITRITRLVKILFFLSECVVLRTEQDLTESYMNANDMINFNLLCRVDVFICSTFQLLFQFNKHAIWLRKYFDIIFFLQSLNLMVSNLDLLLNDLRSTSTPSRFFQPKVSFSILVSTNFR